MIIKTGIDLIEVSRIVENINKFGEAFLNRIYTKKEIEYCESKKVQKYQSYAGRFAAKEAIFKAVSECLNSKFDIEWKDIEILNDENGRPSVYFYGSIAKKLNQNYTIDVSISHIGQIAAASTIFKMEV